MVRDLAWHTSCLPSQGGKKKGEMHFQKTVQKEIPAPLVEKPSLSRTPQKIEVASSEEKPPAPQRKAPSIPEKPLDISGFKLEAIVWARDPESRFAVINGKIVRAGGSMGGMTIKEVGRNHVTLESGSREADLRFRAE